MLCGELEMFRAKNGTRRNACLRTLARCERAGHRAPLRAHPMGITGPSIERVTGIGALRPPLHQAHEVSGRLSNRSVDKSIHTIMQILCENGSSAV